MNSAFWLPKIPSALGVYLTHVTMLTLAFISWTVPSYAAVVTTTDTQAILHAIGVPAGTTATYTGDPSAIGYSTTPLTHFPPGSETTFAVLSSGRVSDVTQANISGSQGTDLGPAGQSGDSATLTLSLEAPDRAAAVGLNFTFLSEEFPEWVGANFNDHFKVFLNGHNIALDTSGNVISVNNNFFDPSLTPTGTFFDGQTPPLTVRAALPESASTSTLRFNVADAGDGLYDTAVFIQGLEYIFPQTLYLAFAETTAEIPLPFLNSYTKPPAKLSSNEQEVVANQVQSVFDNFLIDVTNSKPTEGDFSTIYVGGTRNDLPDPAQLYFPTGVVGMASSTDLGNDNRNDFALIFSGHSFFSSGGGTNLSKLTQVIAHEAGHILGLFHVLPDVELMYPYAGNLNRTAISNAAVKRAEINAITGRVEPIGGTQNSYQELVRNVGLGDTSIIIKESSLRGQRVKHIKIVSGSLLSSVHNLKLGVLLYSDAFPTFFDIENVNSKGILDIEIPVSSLFEAFLLGASTPGGPFDIFGTINNIVGLNPGTVKMTDLLRPLIGTPTLQLFQKTAAGFSAIGKVTLNLSPQATSVPEPPTFWLVIIGAVALVVCGSNRKRCYS